jgi:hypothetical protein
MHITDKLFVCQMGVHRTTASSNPLFCTGANTFRNSLKALRTRDCAVRSGQSKISEISL